MKIFKLIIWKIFNFFFNYMIKFNIINKIRTKLDYQIFHLNKKHVFSGYYDFCPISIDDKYLLCNVVDKDSQCKVGYFKIDSKKNEFIEISNTECWSWQLGARLKWSKKFENSFYFNYYSKEKKSLGTIRYSIDTKKFVFFKNCFFDINQDEDKKLFLNFERLEHFRPGYGHKTNINDNNFQKNSHEDGIFIQNINNDNGKNESKLIISLHEVSELENKSQKKIPHYFNHISFNPSGIKFLFFDCWEENNKRKTKIFISDLHGNYEAINNLDIASHYLWLDDNEILIFCKPRNNVIGFYKYNIFSKLFNHLPLLQKEDGHPVLSKNKKIIIDTYPNQISYRSLFSYDERKNVKTEIGNFYTSNSFISGEKKCDLHPRNSISDQYISIDLGKEEFRETVLLKV